jgi:putative hydrolase of the HAD superfamily
MASAQAISGGGLEAVLLDALGTLLELEPPAQRLRAGLAAEAGIEVEEPAAAAAFRAEIEYYLAHHLRGRDARSLAALRDDCADVVRRSLGLPLELAPAVRRALLGAIRFRPYPDAGPALAALRARGARLVVASNWDCSLAEALAGAGLGGAVDAVVPSALVGAAKPDPRLFDAALAAAGAAPERAVHVGDSLDHDVAGARAAGVRPLLLRRRGDPVEPTDVVTIRSLAELPGVLFEAE